MTPAEAYRVAFERIERARERDAQSLTLRNLPVEILPPLHGLPKLRQLTISNTLLTDLSALEAVPKLKRLYVNRCRVSDLSAISYLTAPTQLFLWGNPITDVAPLAEATSVTHLSLASTEVIDLTPLGALRRLRELDVSNTPLRSLKGTEELYALESLRLGATLVDELSPISNLKRLRWLSLHGCPVTDLEPIAQLENLLSLDLEKTSVSDLEPIARHLSLRSLDIQGSRVQDISAIGTLRNLRNLYLSHTSVRHLSSIKDSKTLQFLSMENTLVDDISPIANLEQIQKLSLDGSRVHDLRPVATMVFLARAARLSSYYGLSFSRCPLTDGVLLQLAERPNPERTIATIDYLRRQQGLPPIESPEDAPDHDLALGERLVQDSLGAVFEQAGDRLAIVASGQASDQDAAKDDVTRQLHTAVRDRAARLADRAKRLGNQPGWQALASASETFSSLMSQDIQSIASDIGSVWAEVVTLGSFIEQDELLDSRVGALVEPLEVDARRCLADVVQVAGPWVRRFPTARILDEEHASFQTPRARGPVARELITAARDHDLVASSDAAAVHATLVAADGEGTQSGKARSYGVLSVRNLVVGGLSIVAVGTGTGFFKHIGDGVAERSTLAPKIENFILDREEALRQLLSDLPADMRAVIRELVKRIRAHVDERGVPLPRAPETASKRGAQIERGP